MLLEIATNSLDGSSRQFYIKYKHLSQSLEMKSTALLTKSPVAGSLSLMKDFRGFFQTDHGVILRFQINITF